jgi:hypothetical protein
MKRSLNKIIDPKDAFEREKRDRYIDLANTYHELSKVIADKGLTVIVKNGNQEFVKVNPAIQEKTRISAAMISLEKNIRENAVQDQSRDGPDIDWRDLG